MNEICLLYTSNPQHTYYFTDVQELDICDKQAVWAYIAEKRIESVSYTHLTVVISNNVRLHLIGFNIHFMYTAAI